MIHYEATTDDLIGAINKTLGTQARQDGWWGRAYADYLRAIASRSHDANRQYWSEVKEAFVKLQCNKCAYCEKPMPEGSKALIDYDVEHHRPKSRTATWPNAATKDSLKIDYQPASGRARGYPELAHHAYNYAVACKVCNSPYKASYFPILGKADEQSYDMFVLNRSERPAVPLPIGDWGEDPGEFLTFEGFVAVPAKTEPEALLRAQVVIDFFELNRRPDLLLGRATAIVMAYQHLKELTQPDLAANPAEAQSWVDGDIRKTAPYASAVRAFKDLFEQDRSKARQFARLSNRYITKKNPELAQQLTSMPAGPRQSMTAVLAALD